MRRLSCLCALCLIACASLASAQDSPAQQQEETTVQAWGGAHPECGEWSDACVVCKREGDKAACSTPGIACTPQPTACRAPLPGTKL